MLDNPAPDTCDHCRRVGGTWLRVEGPEQEMELEDGRLVVRRGRAYVCGGCGHTVTISSPGLRHQAWEQSKR